MASSSQFLQRRFTAGWARNVARSVTSRASSRLVQPAHAHPFSLSSPRQVKQYPDGLSTNEKTKTDLYPDDQHATRKGDRLNVHEDSVYSGMDAKEKGEGGHATEERDSAGGVKKAKQENPEAPDPAIGMQDERGGRGV